MKLSRRNYFKLSPFRILVLASLLLSMVLVACGDVELFPDVGTQFSQGEEVAHRCYVNYDAGGGQGELPAQQFGDPATSVVVASGDALTRADGTEIFAYWINSADNSIYHSGDSFPLKGSVTLVAHYVALPYLSYDGDANIGGTVPDKHMLKKGEAVTLADGSSLYKIGAIFAHWEDRSTSPPTAYEAGSQVTLFTDLKLFAVYKPRYLHVHFAVPEEAGQPVLIDQLIPYGSYASRPTINPPGLVDWYEAATGGAVFDFAHHVIFEDTTVYPVYVQNVSVSFDTQGGDPSYILTQNVKRGTLITKPTDPKKDYFLFNGWYDQPTGGHKIDLSTPIGANMTLYAQWTPITYTVVVHGNFQDGKGTVARSFQFTGVSPHNIPLIPGSKNWYDDNDDDVDKFIPTSQGQVVDVYPF